MLVLTRKAGEDVFIGKDVRVVVSAVRGNRVKLAFSAPEDIPIQRGEVRQARPCEPEIAPNTLGLSIAHADG
jgi:carbon storage regulator